MENEHAYYYEETDGSAHSDTPRLTQRTPWWAISIVFHSAFLVMAAMWILSEISPKEKTEFVEIVPLRPYIPPQTVRTDMIHKKVRLDMKPEIVTDYTVIADTEDLEIDPLTSPLDPDNDDKLTGEENNLTHLDLKGTGVTGFYGVGGGSLPGKFGFRGKGKRGLAMRRYGGGGTEGPVLAALRWFKRHQAPDGSWSMEHYSDQCRQHPPCTCAKLRCSSSGMDKQGWSEKNCATGFALLCYLGHGDTHKAGGFRQQVNGGLFFLENSQKEDGSFSDNNYCHAIAAMAVAEAYGMTMSPRLKVMAQKAVDVILARQNEYMGWNYRGPNPRNDTSVTGWQVMALKSAHSAGLETGNAFEGIISHLNKVTPEVKGDSYPMLAGEVAYTYHTSTKALGHRNNRLTAIGLLARVYAGEDIDSSMLRAHANMIIRKLPEQSDSMDFYRWYYATLAMFQMGKGYWEKWNSAMKKTFIDTQNRGGCEDGSWDPDVSFGNRGGRVFATAVGCLSLEIYYRCLPVAMWK